MTIRNILVAGAGVLGHQIAFQSAFHNYNVTLFDTQDHVIKSIPRRLTQLQKMYERDLQATPAEVQAAYDRITVSTSLSEVIADIDLVIEAVPEHLEIKQQFYSELSQLAPEHTIFATNTSALRPEDLSLYTGRPDRFIALHFTNEIWKRNTVEIMRTEETSQATTQCVIDFAERIGMVHLPVFKSHPGYITNSLFMPFTSAATCLFGNHVSDPMTIDRAWMCYTQNKIGPFGMMDIVGTKTQQWIHQSVYAKKPDAWRKHFLETLAQMMQQEATGKFNSRGFYTYPNPQFEAPAFLENTLTDLDIDPTRQQVVIIGKGEYSVQLAILLAKHGFEPSIHLMRNCTSKQLAQRIFMTLHHYQDALRMNDYELKMIYQRIHIISDVTQALKHADVVIEALPERAKSKLHFYQQDARTCAPSCMIMSMTPTLDILTRPDTIAAVKNMIHVHVPYHAWSRPFCEILFNSTTSQSQRDFAQHFMDKLGLAVIPISASTNQTILNTLLMPVLFSALTLVVEGVTDIESVDKTWMINFEAPQGPFGIMDDLGLTTMRKHAYHRYHISGNEADLRICTFLDDYISRGHIGRTHGIGFYDYINGVPYESPTFLAGAVLASQ